MGELNYFAEREEKDTSTPIASTNFFATQQKEMQIAEEEAVEELPVTQQLEGIFGPQDTWQDYRSSNEHVQTAVSDSITWASNMLVDGGMKLIKSIIPDDWQDGIISYSRDAWESISQLPGVEEGIELAQKGMSEYTEWALSNPNIARRLEEVVNIGSVAGPKFFRTPAFDKAVVQGKRAKHTNRRASIGTMMEPLGKRGDGTIVINPKNKRKEYVPSGWEVEVNNEVVRTAGVKPSAPFTDNWNVLLTKARKLRNQLDAKISNNNVPLNTDKLLTGIANKINAIDEDSLLVGNARDQAIRIYKKAKKELDASDGTALGVMNARRAVDDWVRTERPKVFDADFEKASGVALKVIRDAMNDAVGTAMKSTEIKASLAKQHRLLTAADKLEGKAYAEADGYYGRILEKLDEVVPGGERLPTTPLAQFHTARVLGAGIAGVAATVSGYRGLKWLAKPEGVAWLKQLKEVAKQNPLLRPEVNALIQLSDGLDPADSED